MSSSVVFSRIAICITAHAWNSDGSLLALCPNDNTIRIYSYKKAEFLLLYTLSEHDSVVTSLDWAPTTNRILSCSQDRNAYVWRWENNEWKPTLVILRLNRAATSCAWSPREDKFAVASGAKLVAICYFEEEYDWWVSKHIKVFQSTVLDIAWHPNNVLIAAASSDSHVRVLSAFVKTIDTKEDIKNDAFGTKLPLGTVCKEIKVGGWVHSTKWSPSGDSLAWSSHDSSLHVLECATSNHTLHTLKHSHLPFMNLLWITPNSFVAAGHDNAPYLFNVTSNGIKSQGSLDTKDSASTVNKNNLATWKDRDHLGATGDTVDQALETKHQNCISVIRSFSRSVNVGTFSTSGLDGAVGIWDLDSLQKSIAGLKIA